MRWKSIVAICSLVVAMLLQGPVANAASAYDDIVHVADSFVLENPGSSCSQDITTTWLSLYLSTSDTAGIASLTSAMTNGGSWGVKMSSFGASQNQLQIIWSEAAPVALTFTANDLRATPTDNNWMHYAQLLLNNSCKVTTYGWDTYIGGYLSTSQDSMLTYRSQVGFFENAQITYPVGYEGQLVPIQAPTAKYVAMGDSFSSGEGNLPFENGTDTSSNKCHRSSQAYPRLLQNDSSLNLGRTAFVACSGATTNDVLGVTETDDPKGKWGESAQINALSADTEVVTITIGGNDVGFKDYLTGCGIWVCGSGSTPYTSIATKIASSTFENNLKSTYEAILDSAPNAEVYVVNYPNLTADDATMCGVFDFSEARNVQDALNFVIWGAVYDVGLTNSRIHLVNTNVTGSPFEGKHYCNGGVSDFNGLDAQLEYSFHPNTQGQEDYAAVIKSAIS